MNETEVKEKGFSYNLPMFLFTFSYLVAKGKYLWGIVLFIVFLLIPLRDYFIVAFFLGYIVEKGAFGVLGEIRLNRTIFAVLLMIVFLVAKCYLW